MSAGKGDGALVNAAETKRMRACRAHNNDRARGHDIAFGVDIAVDHTKARSLRNIAICQLLRTGMSVSM